MLCINARTQIEMEVVKTHRLRGRCNGPCVHQGKDCKGACVIDNGTLLAYLDGYRRLPPTSYPERLRGGQTTTPGGATSTHYLGLLDAWSTPYPSSIELVEWQEPT